MGKLQNYIDLQPVQSFLWLTIIISLISFSLMFTIPNAQTPESSTGLPIWLIAIWSPNIATLIVWAVKKNLVNNLSLAFSFPKLSWWTLLILTPIVIAITLISIEILNGNNIKWSNFKFSYLFPLIIINLFMGPIGEELGWRAFLYPNLKNNYGWLASAFIVGVIWALWHAPLWLLDSPQSKIPFWAFSVNVICLSIIMSILYNHSKKSIIPIILLHLTYNVCLGVIDIFDTHESGNYVIKSLFIYIPFIILLLGLHEYTGKGECHLN